MARELAADLNLGLILTALGAFMAGIGSVLTGIAAIRAARRRNEKEVA